MVPPKFKFDFKKLSKGEIVSQVTKQLGAYEKRVQGLIKGFDIKSRDARSKSRKQIDKFAKQINKTRSNLEKQLTSVIHKESKWLEKGVNELFKKLKNVAKDEKLATSKGGKKPAKKKAKTAAKKKSAKGATKSVRKAIAKKTAKPVSPVSDGSEESQPESIA